MTRRIFSLETEYALMVEGRNAGAPGSDLYDSLEQVLRSRHATAVCDPVGQRASSHTAGLVELKEGLFLDCGARVYYDTGHVEWACPECDSAGDATVWDLAADRELEHAAREAGSHGSPLAGSVLVIKNNLDYFSHSTYGCHENYSVRREVAGSRDSLAGMDQLLPAFLVTRSLLCGAGRIGASPECHEEPVSFQLSQRADFIGQVVSRGTRDHRAILNTRDEPLADERRYRRLHLILGDSNLSAWSTFLKLGTTGLMLDALEAGRLRTAPRLQEPVRALREVSRDLECRRRYRLVGGEMATAVEIQRQYWQAASDTLAEASPGDPRRQTLRLWAEALDDLQADPARLRERADWQGKYQFFSRDVLPRLKTSWGELQAWSWIIARTASFPLPCPETLPGCWRSMLPREEYTALETAAADHRLDWRDYLRQRRNYFTLRSLDVRYHDLDRCRARAFRSSEPAWPPGTNDAAVEAARRQPPHQTRAWLRGLVLRSSQRHVMQGMDWDRIHLVNGRTVCLPDPFTTRHPEIESIFGLPPSQ